jgi:hypothetical protein
MAIGAVTISFMLAFLGSTYISLSGGLGFFGGLALYASFGVVVLSTVMTGTAIAMIRENL